MLINISLGFVALIITFLAYVAFQPNDFRYERSAVINAPASVIYGHINDLKLWDAWSPWAKMDPNAKKTFEGPSSGVDAKMSWSGNAELGEGSMTITESKPTEFIKMRLDFVKPMKATNFAEFTLEPQDNGQTKITWAMYGKNDYVTKIFDVFMNFEKMIGGNFDQGLASLKSIAETQAKAE